MNSDRWQCRNDSILEQTWSRGRVPSSPFVSVQFPCDAAPLHVSSEAVPDIISNKI